MSFQCIQDCVKNHASAIQAIVATAANQIIGRLGYLPVTVVTVQSAFLLSYTAVKVADCFRKYLTDKKFESDWLKPNWLTETVATAVGVGAGLAVNKFFYPGKALAAVIDPAGAVVLTAILLAVKYGIDYCNSNKEAWKDKGAVKTDKDAGKKDLEPPLEK